MSSLPQSWSKEPSGAPRLPIDHPPWLPKVLISGLTCHLLHIWPFLWTLQFKQCCPFWNLHCNSVSPKVISTYVSSLKTAARRYNWNPDPLHHHLISAFLRRITINTRFTPTPCGTFDLTILACISRACTSGPSHI